MRRVAASKLSAMHALVSVVLLVATSSVYFQVRGHQFIEYDDRANIVENPTVAGGLSGAGVIEAFTRPGPDNLWYPLTWISFQVDQELHGLSSSGVLLGNLILHVASSILLYWVMWRMTSAVGPSAFVAAVFALHPLHVESVAWAFERKDSLSGFFWMLTMLAYVRACERPGPGRSALVALSYGLGLLAKPSLVTLPFALLLLDYWPLGRLGDRDRPLRSQAVVRAFREKWPLFLLAAVVSGVTLVTQQTSGLRGQLGLDVRVLNAFQSTLWYIAKTVWPSGLAIFYPHPLGDISVLYALACGIVLVAITAAAARVAVARPYLLVGWLWYVGNLVPVIGVVQAGSQAHADRYSYIPMIGLAMATAFWAGDWAGGRAPRLRALAAAGLAICAALGVVAWNQVGYWRNEETVFRRAAAVTEGNALAYHQIAKSLFRNGDLEGARLEYERSLAIAHESKQVQFEYASLLALLGRSSQSRHHYAIALELALAEGDAAFAADVRSRLGP